jgi:hypothetical protein
MVEERVIRAVRLENVAFQEAGDGKHVAIVDGDDMVIARLSREQWQELSTQVSYGFRWAEDAAIVS